RSSSRLNSETPIAKAVGVLFCPQESFHKTTLSQPSQEMAIGEIPSEMTGQFLVWCSSFFLTD
ncbi:hypothetical protein, partial [Pseudomonas zeae]|uniref:hypothetical protein n=1 Tax=Pseudomonas zeae TaxID=2745510 RepID=UPI003CFEEC2D